MLKDAASVGNNGPSVKTAVLLAGEARVAQLSHGFCHMRLAKEIKSNPKNKG